MSVRDDVARMRRRGNIGLDPSTLLFHLLRPPSSSGAGEQG